MKYAMTTPATIASRADIRNATLDGSGRKGEAPLIEIAFKLTSEHPASGDPGHRWIYLKVQSSELRRFGASTPRERDQDPVMMLLAHQPTPQLPQTFFPGRLSLSHFEQCVSSP